MNKISALNKLNEIAELLEKSNLDKEAQVITNIMVKLSARGKAVYNEDSGVPYEVFEANNDYAQQLAQQIDSFNRQAEESRWSMEDDIEDGGIPGMEDGYPTHTTAAPENNMRQGLINAQIDWCYQELGRIGARLEGPYEHWGEDAAWIQRAEGE